MELDLSMFLIICPLFFIADLIDAIGGGGGLISLPACLIAGLPGHLAVGTNKLASSLGAIVSTVRYYKGRKFDYYMALIGIATAFIGAVIGAKIALYVDDVVFEVMLIVLLPLVAAYVLLKRDLEPKKNVRMSKRKQYIIVALSTLFLGMYDGFYGPGSGTFLLLVYTGLAKMNILNAEAYAKLVNLTATLSSAIVFLINGSTVIPLGLAAAVFSMAGHYVGSGIAIRNGSKVVRTTILIVLGILLLKVMYNAGSYLFNYMF